MLVALLVLPIPARAIFDQKQDSFGLYWDAAGNSYVREAQPFAPFTGYLILANPLGPVDGYECTITRVSAPSHYPSYMLSVNLGTGAVDSDPSADGFAVMSPTPYPVAGGAVVLATIQYMLAANNYLEFYIGPGTTQTLPGDLPIVFGNGVPRQCTVHSCDIHETLAWVNGMYPIFPLCWTYDYRVSARLRVSSGGATSQEIVAGNNALASAGYDPDYDMPSPPPAPDSIVAMNFEHADWPVGPRFRTDYIRWHLASEEGYRVWPLLVETTVAGDLSFELASMHFDGGCMFLHDLQTDVIHAVIPPWPTPLVIPGASPGPASLRYELILGDFTTPPELEPVSRPLSTGWSMIGLPLTPPVGSTVLSLIDYPAPGAQVVYRYGQGTGYTQLGATTMVHPDAGYWLATSEAYDWTMTGSRDLDGVTVPLDAGWNLVGFANWFAAPTSGLRVVQGATTRTWEAAVLAGLVSPDLQTWDAATGSYVAATDLQPWHGYWVSALTGGLSLFFQWENFLAAKQAAAPAPFATHAAAWEVTLTLFDAVGHTGTLVVGRRADATAGFDPLLDRPLPPPSPAGGPRLSSQRPEWGLATGAAFARDYAGVGDLASAWTLAAQVTAPGPATLQWTVEAWPQNVDAELVLVATGQIVVPSLRAQSSYALPAANTALVLRERSWVSGAPDVPVAATASLTAWPNPFNPRVTFAFAVPRAGRAEVRVYSLRGELMAVAGAGDYLAGPHEAVWDGRLRDGREAPSGAYRARLYVDGQDAGAVVGVSLVR
jgi:hypothetical protein